MQTNLTDLHVREALAGDSRSIEWIVARFSPILEVHARDQLIGGLRGLYEPLDIVNTVWERVLPKLPSLCARDYGLRRALLAFLHKVQSDLCTDLLRQFLRRQHFARVRNGDDDVVNDPVQRLVSDQTSIFSRVARDEQYLNVLGVLSDLDRADRDVIYLRALHGVSNAEAARTLGINEDAASQRYHRAIGKLRDRLPPAVFESLES